mgnify:CR=1 FL=1
MLAKQQSEQLTLTTHVSIRVINFFIVILFFIDDLSILIRLYDKNCHSFMDQSESYRIADVSYRIPDGKDSFFVGINGNFEPFLYQIKDNDIYRNPIDLSDHMETTSDYFGTSFSSFFAYRTRVFPHKAYVTIFNPSGNFRYCTVQLQIISQSLRLTLGKYYSMPRRTRQFLSYKRIKMLKSNYLSHPGYGTIHLLSCMTRIDP